MTKRDWSTDGLTLISDSDGRVRCASSHLTAFSVLLDPRPVPVEDEGHQVALSLVSYIGAALSIVGLGLTVLTYSMFRSLNRDRSGKILLNLCISLLLMNLAFLLSSLRSHVTSVDVCTGAAILVHYLVLTSLLWMLVEAVHMHQMLITVFASAETHFVAKRVAVAWGVPMVVVGGTAAADLGHYRGSHPDFCLVSPAHPYVYYTTFLTPACLILAVNVIVFVLVARVLFHRKAVGKVTGSGNASTNVTMAQVRGAFTVMTLLGVTWVFGAFAIGPARLAFQYFFCIANSLQGFIIFVVRCVFYPEARSCWVMLLTTGKVKKHRGTPFANSTYLSKQSGTTHTHVSHTSSAADGYSLNHEGYSVGYRIARPVFHGTHLTAPRCRYGDNICYDWKVREVRQKSWSAAHRPLPLRLGPQGNHLNGDLSRRSLESLTTLQRSNSGDDNTYESLAEDSGKGRDSPGRDSLRRSPSVGALTPRSRPLTPLSSKELRLSVSKRSLAVESIEDSSSEASKDVKEGKETSWTFVKPSPPKSLSIPHIESEENASTPARKRCLGAVRPHKFHTYNGAPFAPCTWGSEEADSGYSGFTTNGFTTVADPSKGRKRGAILLNGQLVITAAPQNSLSIAPPLEDDPGGSATDDGSLSAEAVSRHRPTKMAEVSEWEDLRRVGSNVTEIKIEYDV
ncbi:unnamed protein product [Darwinula stevensoni]|uniref:G-protein coupled receptors family 2 profile 2 domain-containing protein n=1 Tax=Darwinula stevensoni TaxID=69355 RepID=A0A7R9AEW2_9CRUS|nr:unnamed protein product [Darwinula stevensoni]CAG0902716.1 unnamed protein product [Darwinula stevensoni]